jgi:hypothetical protein
MEWCCQVFRGWLGHAGHRGLGVFVSTEKDPSPSFILQFRAQQPGEPIPHTQNPLSSVLDVNIHFCPWCGTNLDKFYRKTFNELNRPGLRVL